MCAQIDANGTVVVYFADVADREVSNPIIIVESGAGFAPISNLAS